MLFGKKRKEINCENCNSKISDNFNFCPHCGYSTLSEQEEQKEFGLLGRNDFTKQKEQNQNPQNPLAGMGITDQLINSIMNKMMKSFDSQMKGLDEGQFEGTHIEQLPNGIKIRIGMPSQQRPKQNKPKNQITKPITEAQLQKMSNLPRAAAKTNVRRLSDKVIYEMSAPGVQSVDDVFISKLEEGYEIKAIGKTKVYVNSLPISLPLKGFSITDKKLLVEFKTEK